MKRVIILSTAIIAAIAIDSCSKEVDFQEDKNSILRPKIIVAHADADITPDTKTTLEGVSVRWNASTDVIMGYDGTDKHSSTGISVNDKTKVATFTFSTVSVEEDLYYLIYPSSAVGTADLNSAEITLPSTQTATANSFANGANIAFAEGGVPDDEVSFKNIGGLLSIIINNDNIVSVEISADEVMTGVGTIDTSDGSVTPGAGSKSVLLNGGLTNGTEYYAVVYPQTYHNLRIEITDNVGKKAVFKNSTPLTVNRNSNTHLATLTASRWFDVVSQKISWTDNSDWSGSGAVLTLTDGDYTVELNKASGGTNPSIPAANDARVYASGTVTVSNSDCRMTSIIFNISTQGKKRLAPITADVGTIKVQSSGDETVEWTGDAKTVVFTVGASATYGSDGASKAGQLCFDEIDVKILDDGKTGQTLSFPQSSYSVVYGNPFSAPSVSGANTTVTYTSSDPSIATVNASTGEITINTSSNYGTTRITAKAASDATYRSASAYYDLTVDEAVALTYYVNGEPTVVNGTEGQLLSELLPVSPSSGIANYNFAGWSEATVATTDTEPTYTTKTTLPAGGLTLYAVFVKESVTPIDAGDVTFDNSDWNGKGSSSPGSEIKLSKSGATLTISNGYGTDAHVRIFSGSSIIFEGERNITAIEITCTANGNSNYGPQKITGTDYVGGTEKTGTWSGTASKTVSLNASAQARVTKIVVSLAAGSTTTYSGYTTSPVAD